MKLADLFEDLKPVPLRKDLTATLPPTILMPQLKSNDSYVQYRYLIALGAAEAIKRGEVDMAQESPWNENTSVVCYTSAEEEIVNLANKHMGLSSKKISKTPSQEPSWVNTKSPVAKFKDFD